MGVSAGAPASKKTHEYDVRHKPFREVVLGGARFLRVAPKGRTAGPSHDALAEWTATGGLPRFAGSVRSTPILLSNKVLRTSAAKLTIDDPRPTQAAQPEDVLRVPKPESGFNEHLDDKVRHSRWVVCSVGCARDRVRRRVKDSLSSLALLPLNKDR